MSIDKESTGIPEVNVHRPDTKVNLWMIVGIVFFLCVGALAAVWVSRHGAAPAVLSADAVEKK